MSEEQPARADRSRLWAVVRGLLGLLGIGAVVWIVNDVGLDELGRVMGPALPWMPLAVALELARVAMDGVSSRQTLGRRGQEVPWLPLLASHLVAFAVMGVAPAGRATAEAVKASLLARWIGGPTAAAMGTANQANVLISSGTFTIVSTAAAFALTGWSVLTQLLLLHVVLMNLFGVGLRAAARYERLGELLATRFPSIGAHVRTFHDATKETSLFPLWPVSSMMLGRLFQAAHYGVIAVAVGMSPSALGALLVHGVYLVVAALGVMIPGQIGASELVFTMSADTLGTTEARAAAIALLAHAVQLLLVLAGFVVLAAGPRRTTST